MTDPYKTVDSCVQNFHLCHGTLVPDSGPADLTPYIYLRPRTKLKMRFLRIALALAFTRATVAAPGGAKRKIGEPPGISIPGFPNPTTEGLGSTTTASGAAANVPAAVTTTGASIAAGLGIDLTSLRHGEFYNEGLVDAIVELVFGSRAGGLRIFGARAKRDIMRRGVDGYSLTGEELWWLISEGLQEIGIHTKAGVGVDVSVGNAAVPEKTAKRDLQVEATAHTLTEVELYNLFRHVLEQLGIGVDASVDVGVGTPATAARTAPTTGVTGSAPTKRQLGLGGVGLGSGSDSLDMALSELADALDNLGLNFSNVGSRLGELVGDLVSDLGDILGRVSNPDDLAERVRSIVQERAGGGVPAVPVINKAKRALDLRGLDLGGGSLGGDSVEETLDQLALALKNLGDNLFNVGVNASGLLGNLVSDIGRIFDRLGNNDLASRIRQITQQLNLRA